MFEPLDVRREIYIVADSCTYEGPGQQTLEEIKESLLQGTDCLVARLPQLLRVKLALLLIDVKHDFSVAIKLVWWTVWRLSFMYTV